MSGETILVVEDEEDIRELLAFNLETEGYKVLRAGRGDEGLKLAETQNPDLLVLDVMLPGLDGFQVTRRLKQRKDTRSLPILMLTAKSQEADMVAGLELGADDYVTKPFSPKVLVARVRSLLRRRSEDAEASDGTLHLHGLSLNIPRHELHCEGEPVALSATEFAILRFLASNPGWVYSRAQIIDAVRGQNYPVTERAVDVQILGLRKKHPLLTQVIETVRGVGYRMKAV